MKISENYACITRFYCINLISHSTFSCVRTRLNLLKFESDNLFSFFGFNKFDQIFHVKLNVDKIFIHTRDTQRRTEEHTIPMNLK